MAGGANKAAEPVLRLEVRGGYKVLLVEKEASVGGKMILLSKVFPTPGRRVHSG